MAKGSVHSVRKAGAGRAPSAKEQAYAHIRQEILSGEVDGDFLTEETVAGTLGISRTPVREAFLRLEADGLLTLVPHRGAFVQLITERDVSEVMEVRSLVEAFAAERVLAMDEATRDELLDRLRALYAEQLAHAEQDPPDAAAFIDCDRRFHLELIATAGNRMLIDLYHRLRDRQTRLGVRAVMHDAKRREQVLREHAVIIDALAAGDLAAACTAITGHLDVTAGVLRSHVSSR